MCNGARHFSPLLLFVRVRASCCLMKGGLSIISPLCCGKACVCTEHILNFTWVAGDPKLGTHDHTIILPTESSPHPFSDQSLLLKYWYSTSTFQIISIYSSPIANGPSDSSGCLIFHLYTLIYILSFVL